LRRPRGRGFAGRRPVRAGAISPRRAWARSFVDRLLDMDRGHGPAGRVRYPNPPARLASALESDCRAAGKSRSWPCILRPGRAIWSGGADTRPVDGFPFAVLADRSPGGGSDLFLLSFHVVSGLDQRFFLWAALLDGHRCRPLLFSAGRATANSEKFNTAPPVVV